MDIFEKNQKESEEKMRKYTLSSLKQMGIGLWAATVIVTSIFAFNEGAGFYSVTGVLADLGAIAIAVVAYMKKI